MTFLYMNSPATLVAEKDPYNTPANRDHSKPRHPGRRSAASPDNLALNGSVRQSKEMDDDSEDVNDFLKRIKELGDKRDREDAERTRKLEEDILQGRREREARRQERARSLSPEKASPSPQSVRSFANTPVRKPLESPIISPPAASTGLRPPQPSRLQETTVSDVLGGQTEKSSVPTTPLASASTSPSRAGTLSWQRRPGSSNSPSKPLSIPASESNSARWTRPTPEPNASSVFGESPKPTAAEELNMSKTQIAQSLGSKDPTWFRQTADRGAGSAAYRRSENGEHEPLDASVTRRLVGLSDGESVVTERPPSPSDSAPSSTSRMSSVRGSAHNAFHPAMSFNQGRMSPERMERPISPTKGMGGFVQSAMLKRSDSVNKRWSAQAGTGLTRQNSTLSLRSGVGTLTSSMSMPKLEPSAESQEIDLDNSDRPVSSHSNGTVTDSIRDLQRDTSRTSHHTRAKSASIISSLASVDDTADISPPPSPSKRFSPTKSSWLESALSKPESTKLKTTPPLSQPSWMAEINKAKQQRSGADHDKSKEPIHPTVPDLPVKPRKFSPRPAAPKEALQEIIIPEDSVSLEPSARQPSPASIEDPRQGAAFQLLEPKHSTPPKTDFRSTSTEVPRQGAVSQTPKPKPNTPPKKDFRSTLKPRQPPADTKALEEPEFRSMFGKLKRTQTEKYVAPDELKSNILRGKADLATSGSPQITERKDALKDSLVKQKETMKLKRGPLEGIERLPPVATHESKKIPEAIVRQQSLRDKPKPTPPLIKHRWKETDHIRSVPSLPNQSFTELPASSTCHLDEQVAESQTSSALSSTDPKSLQITGVATESTSPAVDETLEAVMPAEPREVTISQSNTPVASKLAKRFNPSLANVIARGLPPATNRAPSGSSTPADEKTEAAHRVKHETEPGSTTSQQLTHMTKTRARGPKRRLPKVESEITSSENRAEVAAPAAKQVDDTVANKGTLESASSKPAESLQLNGYGAHHEGIATEKSKPPTPLKSPSLKLTSPKLQQKSNNDKTLTLKVSPQHGEVSAPTVSAPNPNREVLDSIQPTTPPVSVRNASALWGRPSPAGGRPMPKSPIKLPTRQEEPSGLGLTFQSAPISPPMSAELPPEKVKSPLLRAQAPGVGEGTKSNVRSLDQTTEAGRLFANFFKQIPSTDHIAPKIDTHQILTSRPDESKVKTLRKTIQEIGPDGKSLLNVPSHQEHVLFSDSMYLCTHVFGGLSGRVTEIYLWVGIGVPESSFEDAQVWARKTAAKDGKFVAFRQGKETPNFFQALGGIVITRRGNRSLDTLTEYVLCGRRHLGHVAFDEVDLSLNLCAGFPYLVCAKSGKVYLWKGVGCNAEELGCARLIGMDLSVTGEIIEVDQGNEPADFLDIFPPLGPKQQRVIPRSAEHWRMKAKQDNYSVRLYRIDQQQQGGASQSTNVGSFWPLVRRPSQQEKDKANNHDAAHQITVTEISPFAQTDLEPEDICVLDAFFEIYIIVGPLATSKFAAFAATLTFATHYGILAASLEDRPFVPVCTVVMEGVPRDMKACFRGWRDDLVDTGALMAGSRGWASVRSGEGGGGGVLGRGRSLRVVSLGAAVEGVRGLEKLKGER